MSDCFGQVFGLGSPDKGDSGFTNNLFYCYYGRFLYTVVLVGLFSANVTHLVLINEKIQKKYYKLLLKN